MKEGYTKADKLRWWANQEKSAALKLEAFSNLQGSDEWLFPVVQVLI